MSQDTGPEGRARTWFWRTWTAIGMALLAYGLFHLAREPLALLGPPIALAAILIYLLNPLVTWFEGRGLHRIIGTILTYVVVLGTLAGLGWLVLPVLVEQTAELVDRLPDIAVSMQDTVNRQLDRLGIAARVSFDPESIQTQQAIEDFIARNEDQFLGLVRGVGTLVLGVLASLLGIILAPVLAFYALIDLPRLSDGVRRLIPPDQRSEVIDVVRRIARTVGAYVRGQLLVSLFVGIATTIGLAVVGLPLFALVGLTAGVFNLIPFIGPFVGGVFGVVVALTLGGGVGQALVVVVVMVAVQQVDNHVITPSILSRTVHVHPVTIIVSLAVFASLFGIIGMLVAVPVVASLKLLVLYVLVTRVPSMAHLAGEGPDVIDGVPVGEPRETSLVSMGRDLRTAYQARRRRRQDDDPERDVSGGLRERVDT